MVSLDTANDAVLRILNASGDEIERFDAGASSALHLRLEAFNLHAAARRTALEVNETLDEVLKELENVE